MKVAQKTLDTVELIVELIMLGFQYHSVYKELYDHDIQSPIHHSAYQNTQLFVYFWVSCEIYHCVI